MGALFPSLTNGETNSLFDWRGVELTFVGFTAKDAGVGPLKFPIISSWILKKRKDLEHNN